MGFMKSVKKLFRKRDYDYFIEVGQQYYELARESTDPKQRTKYIDLARDALASAIKINASRPEAYFVRAQLIMLAVEDSNDLVLAKQDLHTVLRNDPTFKEKVEPLMKQIETRLANSRAL